MNVIWKIACTGLLWLSVIFASCKNNAFDGGGHLFDKLTVTGMIDTVTIKISNLVESDSVITAGRSDGKENIGFSGAYYDPQTGTVRTQTYIEFARTSDSERDRYARFDSVTLVMRPNGEYFGDTVKRAAFRVSRLEKPIEKRDDGRLYSTSYMPPGIQLADTAQKVKVRYTGEMKICPKCGTQSRKETCPNCGEKLGKVDSNEFEIRLPNSFGRWLLQGVLRDDDEFKPDKFLKTFPGLLVGAGTGSDCVHGLNLSDTACMIRIYYHINTTYKEDKTMTFMANPYNSFYNLRNDKENLPHYNSKSDPVPSSKTGNKGIVMSGGTPMYTRLEFPYLNELQWLGQIVKIRKATLYVRPIQRTFDIVPLPPKLNIYYFDPTSNEILSGAIKPPSSNDRNTGPQDGNLPKNYHLLESPFFPQYTFDVTDFIASQLGKKGYEKWAICLAIPDGSRETTLQRLVFGNQEYWYNNEVRSRDNRIKLEIIYEATND